MQIVEFFGIFLVNVFLTNKRFFLSMFFLFPVIVNIVFCAEIWYVLNGLLIKFSRCWFFIFIILVRTRTFSPISKLLHIFFPFGNIFFSFVFVKSIWYIFWSFYSFKIKYVPNLWLDIDFPRMTFGLRSYFLLLTLFIFLPDCLMIVAAGILAFFYQIWLLALIFYCSVL